jgi:hypothetical protein
MWMQEKPFSPRNLYKNKLEIINIELEQAVSNDRNTEKKLT